MPEHRCVSCGNMCAQHYKRVRSQNLPCYQRCPECIALMTEELDDDCASEDGTANSTEEQDAESDAGEHESAKK